MTTPAQTISGGTSPQSVLSLLLCLSLLITSGLRAQTVDSFTLVDAGTNAPVNGFDPIPADATIDTSAIGSTNLNIRANTTPTTDFGSVQFSLTGATSEQRTENVPVWALFGDSGGNFNNGSFNAGNHTLTATPYPQDSAGGTAGSPSTLNFTVTAGGGGGDDGEDPDEPLDPPADPGPANPQISGELKRWHKVTLTIDGPETSEIAERNPFLDFRMDVTFTHPATGLTYVVPGYFAADGDAANTSADSGNKWRAHLCPDETGTWEYTVSFRWGNGVAVSDSPDAGSPLAPTDGTTGSFSIQETDKSGRDHRGKGRLEYVNERYLKFAGSGEYFLKQGPDAPENFLAYDDFDGTPNDDDNNSGRANLRKSWSPHQPDYDPADAQAYTWQDGKGSEMLGAIRYLADVEGLNALSFLTFSLDGDDDNVFPHRLIGSLEDYRDNAENQAWSSSTAGVHHTRFDVSKLDQWEKIFEYADKKGMYLHFKTQETENDQKMDGGALGPERKAYYRELIARFSHHLALNWNLGEENTNSDSQRKAFAQFFWETDPYQHNIVVHTYPGQKGAVYSPLLGAPDEGGSYLTGASLQGGSGNFGDVHGDVTEWVEKSAATDRPWVVAVDEPGNAGAAIRPDANAGNSQEQGRVNALWGTFLGGGAGNEWYFGYQYAESDLTLQDFRSRDRWWDYCRFALRFFQDNSVPFWEMTNDNSLSGGDGGYTFAKPGEVYVMLLPDGGSATLDLTDQSGEFAVHWFDPRNGGDLLEGSVTSISGGGVRQLGSPPDSPSEDWVVIVRERNLLSFIEYTRTYGLSGSQKHGLLDHDGDGTTTFGEYILGRIPTLPDGFDGLPRADWNPERTRLVMVMNLPMPVPAGVLYEVLAGDLLETNGDVIASKSSGSSWSGPAGVATRNLGNGFEEVKVTDVQDVDAATTARYMRLRGRVLP